MDGDEARDLAGQGIGNPDPSPRNGLAQPLWPTGSEAVSLMARAERLYSGFVATFGPDARSAWIIASTTTVGRRRAPGRPRASWANEEADIVLLMTYLRRCRGLSEKQRAHLVTEIAREFKARIPRWFPATEKAVAKRLRRLLRSRRYDIELGQKLLDN
jgi:hypothetical protein